MAERRTAAFPSVEACQRKRWSLLLWKRGAVDRATGEISSDQSPVRIPFLCGSWRCQRCRLWRGALDWSRVRDGLASRDWWLYVVLTFDPSRFGGLEDAAGAWRAYKAGYQLWSEGLKRALERAVGRIEYVQTWERHRSGWPHVNVLLTGAGLRELVAREGLVEREISGPSGRVRRAAFPRRFRRKLLDLAAHHGFGRMGWVELVDRGRPDAMAGYLVKLARELTGSSNEATKGYQSPLNAPRHFRRIRASRGVLPPIPTGELTGMLQTIPLDLEQPDVHRPGDRLPHRAETWETVFLSLEAKAKQSAAAWAATIEGEPEPTVPAPSADLFPLAEPGQGL
jgi:hypothetical protein